MIHSTSGYTSYIYNRYRCPSLLGHGGTNNVLFPGRINGVYGRQSIRLCINVMTYDLTRTRFLFTLSSYLPYRQLF